MGRWIDDDDEVIYSEAFRMAAAVQRFLRRKSTQRAADAGFLDEDVVRDLVEANNRMWLARIQRVSAARNRHRGADDGCAR